jgi:lipopolysaccharide transport system ATP-binding protein
MNDVAKAGRTVLFVSHNMASVEGMCATGLLLREGTLASQGTATQIISDYLADDMREEGAVFKDASGVVEEVKLMNGEASPRKAFAIGETIIIEVVLGPIAYPAALAVGIGVNDALGSRVTTFSTKFQGLTVSTAKEGTRVQCRVESLALAPGHYGLKVGVGNHYENISVIELACAFEVLATDFYGCGEIPTRSQGSVLAKHSWRVVNSSPSLL